MLIYDVKSMIKSNKLILKFKMQRITKEYSNQREFKALNQSFVTPVILMPDKQHSTVFEHIFIYDTLTPCILTILK